ncbi:hypothetical protein ACP70R_033627 [Stipagrostis hirtigluma subsp. patula]
MSSWGKKGGPGKRKALGLGAPLAAGASRPLGRHGPLVCLRPLERRGPLVRRRPLLLHQIPDIVVAENEFVKNLPSDVIPPNDIGLTFEDIEALDNVKDTLKELVMVPLRNLELFSKRQIKKKLFGEAEKYVKTIFLEIKLAPAVIFIDEVLTVCAATTDGGIANTEWVEQVIMRNLALSPH